MNSVTGVFRAEAQTPRGLLSEAVAEALKKLVLHQIQLLRPDGIGAADQHLSAPFGDRAGNGGDLLPDSLGPGRLQRR
jgi:hypothetical protein